MGNVMVATWYVAVVGSALFCGGTYDPAEVWIALPFGEYGQTWQCGDLVVLWFPGETAAEGILLTVRVRDTGPFGANCVMQVDGSCIRIGVDIPRQAFPLHPARSARVVITNISALAREGRVQ